MWHYNGKTWKVVDIYNSAGSNGNLSAVHGSSSTNIWAVGYRGRYDPELGRYIEYPFIVHFDGSKWTRHKVKTKHATYGVYVEGENNVWACGDGRLIYHYDGNGWSVDTIKIEMKENEETIAYQIVEYNSEVFTTVVKRVHNEGWGTLYFLRKQAENWIKMDSSSWGFGNYKFDIGGLYVSKQNELYSHGMGGIFKWGEGHWNNIFSLETSINSIDIESENNIIAVGGLSGAYHYNGSDWKQFEKIRYEDVMYTGVLLYRYEAFIIGNTSVGTQTKTIVLHGQ
jgi:hypothetical protein